MMTILVLDRNPETAATYHSKRDSDRKLHEYVWMLCSVHWLHGADAPFHGQSKNHPCTKWAASTVENYRWLWRLAKALSAIYFLLYGKEHQYTKMLAALRMPPGTLVARGFSKHVIFLPEKFKSADPVDSYRAYYSSVTETPWNSNQKQQ